MIRPLSVTKRTIRPMTDPLKAEALRQLQQAVQHDLEAFGITPTDAWLELKSRIAGNDHHSRPSLDWRGATE